MDALFSAHVFTLDDYNGNWQVPSAKLIKAKRYAYKKTNHRKWFDKQINFLIFREPRQPQKGEY